MKKASGLLCYIVVAFFMFSGRSLAGEKVFFYHTDPAGTPLAMTDASGNVVWRADYKPFGEEQSITQTKENEMRFVGKEKDKETGLQYFGVRYMKDEIGRFITVDPVGPVDPWTSKTNYEMLTNPQKLNRYAYSLNNPYRYLDPNGKWPTEVHNTIITTAFSSGGYRLSPSAIAALERGSAEADSRKYQDPAHSYMHAMSEPNQSAEAAAGRTVTFIMEKVAEYKSLMAEGKTADAYFALGMAMHPLMDATSPSHEGIQTWNSPWTHPLEAWEHMKKESVERFNANPTYLQKSIDSLRNFYDANK